MTDTDFDEPTDVIRNLLLSEEAEALADAALRTRASECLASINADAIERAEAPYGPIEEDKPVNLAHLRNESQRSALWRLRCFADPTLRRPSNYVGYLTIDEIERAIATLGSRS